MISTRFTLARGLVLCFCCAACSFVSESSRAPAPAGPFASADYIRPGRRGELQTRIYRIALSPAGRALVKRALAELDGLDLPVIARGEKPIPAAERRARLERAVAHARDLVALEEASPCAREFLGLLYYRAGRKTEARAAFRAAAERNPGDAYLAGALERWLTWLDQDRPLYYDGFVRQMFPGYELDLMERRLKPRAEGVYENHHVFVRGMRFGATPSRNQIFDLMETSETPLEALVIGSSRVREGVRPVFIRRELQQAFGRERVGGVLNLSYGGASTRFFLGALRYLKDYVDRKGRRIPFVVLGTDLEMLSHQGIAFLNPEFKEPLVLSRAAWGQFLAGRGQLEVWPYWRFSSRPASWQALPWSVLKKRPRRYAFPAQPLNYQTNPVMLREIEEILALLKAVAVRPVLIENPVPTFYNEKWSANSSRPILKELCKRYELPFVVRELSEWGLNDGHFYGSVIQDPELFDYLHLNYPGSHIWSREIGRVLAELGD